MPRTGELTYFERIGHSGREHAVAKPFSDDDCGLYLMRVGALFGLMPPPPCRILECGCGTGWLSHFLARSGYDVVAADVAPDAIRLARENPVFLRGGLPRFVVADSEALPFESEFDVVIFFDSLHHCVDEREALRGAHRALRPGGMCITLEPGRGHHKKSAGVEAEHDVTEKDMPPAWIGRLGCQVGFRSCTVYAAPQQLGKALYARSRIGSRWLRAILGVWPFGGLAVMGILATRRRGCGIAVLRR
jgi:SAM-dependent methyltransferase